MAEAQQTSSQRRGSRKRDILEALARELEGKPGERITTASLARAVGVSEAALYRHFPSKARMYEGLLEFMEESVFGLVNHIMDEEKDAVLRCEKILNMLLQFAERNPGMSRLLMGDALVGEHVRLRVRTGQFFDRLETQLKQVLREGYLYAGQAAADVTVPANLMIAAVEGRIHQYVRSGFARSPMAQWPEEWQLLRRSIFTTASS
jgi:TetR/AcrR family transcriptional regulator